MKFMTCMPKHKLYKKLKFFMKLLSVSLCAALSFITTSTTTNYTAFWPFSKIFTNHTTWSRIDTFFGNYSRHLNVKIHCITKLKNVLTFWRSRFEFVFYWELFISRNKPLNKLKQLKNFRLLVLNVKIL